MTTFASDDFTGVNGTALGSHTPSGGGSWTEHGSYTSGAMEIRANRCRPSGGFNPSLFYHSGAPGGSNAAEYDVAADVVMLTDNSGIVAVAGRVDTGANTYYEFRKRFNDSIVLQKRVAGTITALANAGLTDASGRLLAQIRDATKKLFWDGVEQLSTTDNEITAAGRAGLWDGGSNSGNNTGIHFDNFQADDLDAGGGGELSPQIINEALNASEARLRLLAWMRIQAATLNAEEARARLMTWHRQQAEMLNASESPSRVMTWLRAAADTLNVSEATSRLVTWLRLTADALQASEAATSLRSFLRTVADTLSVSEAATALKSFLRFIADTLSVSEAVSSVKSLLRIVSETLQLSEARARLVTWARQANDSLQTSEALVRVGSWLRATADSLAASEGVTRLVTWLRLTGATLSASEGVTRTRDLVARVISDTLQLVEGTVRSVFETIVIAVTAARLLARDFRTWLTSSDQRTTLTPADEATRLTPADYATHLTPDE